MKLYETPFSTNVERVTLALAHKGLEVEHVVMARRVGSLARSRRGRYGEGQISA